MATTSTKKPEMPKAEGVEKVKIKLPRGTGVDPQVYVSVNDYTCIIPRGVEVEVPIFVKEELDRSEAAREKFFVASDELLMQ